MDHQTLKQAQPASTQEYDAGKLLEEVLARTPSERYKAVDHALSERINKLEELLPDKMKGQGARLVKRAMLTFSRTEKLQACTPASFIRCVLEAAELGLAIDGKLAHAVPYRNKEKQPPVVEANFQVDYKGLIQVAKRGGTIKDCYGDVVHENDVFVARRVNGGSELEHSYQLGKPRGEPLGAYAVIVQSDGWRYELMDVAELDKIRARSKAFQYGDSSPWTTDLAQMRIKTVIKRGLKLYSDDPAVVRALELDDGEYEHSVPAERHDGPPVGKVDLRNVPLPQPSQGLTPDGEKEAAAGYVDMKNGSSITFTPSSERFQHQEVVAGPPPAVPSEAERVHKAKRAIAEATTQERLDKLRSHAETLAEPGRAEVLGHINMRSAILTMGQDDPNEAADFPDPVEDDDRRTREKAMDEIDAAFVAARDQRGMMNVGVVMARHKSVIGEDKYHEFLLAYQKKYDKLAPVKV